MKKRLLALWLVMMLPLTAARAVSSDFLATFADVGAGDCILLQQGGVTWLVDTGPADAWPQVEQMLNDRGIVRIDRLVLTHMHADHTGNLQKVLERWPVGEVWISGGVTDEDAAAVCAVLDVAMLRTTRVFRRDTAMLGKAEVVVLSPWRDTTYTEQNNASVMMRISFAGRSLLLTGDAQLEADMAVWEGRDELRIDADVLKAGHHGMMNGTAYPFARAVGAETVVVSCGAVDKKATLAQQTAETLQACGAKEIYATGGNGNVTICISTDGNLQIEGTRIR